jgi:hypothetical protein
MPQRATQAIEFPDDQDVTFSLRSRELYPVRV